MHATVGLFNKTYFDMSLEEMRRHCKCLTEFYRSAAVKHSVDAWRIFTISENTHAFYPNRAVNHFSVILNVVLLCLSPSWLSDRIRGNMLSWLFYPICSNGKQWYVCVYVMWIEFRPVPQSALCRALHLWVCIWLWVNLFWEMETEGEGKAIMQSRRFEHSCDYKVSVLAPGWKANRRVMTERETENSR